MVIAKLPQLKFKASYPLWAIFPRRDHRQWEHHTADLERQSRRAY